MLGIVLLGAAFVIASALIDADTFYKDYLYDPTLYLVRVN